MERWRAAAHARAWRSASSYAELCELGARFVTGELCSFPGWGAPRLDAESLALVPCLYACNRGGFLTIASQPGVARAQRAFVAGFASEDAVLALRSIAREEIMIREERPGELATAALPVSLSGGREAVLAGGAARQAELAIFGRSIGPRARAELATLPFVWAIDLAWESRETLWSGLMQAFTPHTVPRPS